MRFADASWEWEATRRDRGRCVCVGEITTCLLSCTFFIYFGLRLRPSTLRRWCRVPYTGSPPTQPTYTLTREIRTLVFWSSPTLLVFWSSSTLHWSCFSGSIGFEQDSKKKEKSKSENQILESVFFLIVEKTRRLEDQKTKKTRRPEGLEDQED